MGLTYFSCNIEPTACTGICRVQDCPEDSVNFFVIVSGTVGVGVEEGGVVVPVACGAVTVSSKEIGSLVEVGGWDDPDPGVGFVDRVGCSQEPCIEKVRSPVF